MIKREMYMKQIKPFIGKDIIKVLTGIRRSRKICYVGTYKKRNKFTKAEYFYKL
jgi:hypothetical protein